MDERQAKCREWILFTFVPVIQKRESRGDVVRTDI